MILLNFTTVLTVLLFATPIADAYRANRCNWWKTCYNKMQQQENSALQEINRKLSNQRIHLIEVEKSKTDRTILNQAVKIQDLQNMVEQNKDEMNNTIFNQSKKIQQELENMLYEQARQVAEKLSVMNNKLEEQSNNLEEQKNKLEEQKNTLVDQNNKITNQNKTIEEYQKKVLVMSNKLEDQSNKLEEQSNNLEEQNNKITNQNNTIEELQKKVLVMNNKFEGQNNKLEEQQNKLEDQSNKLVEQNNKLEDQTSKISNQDKTIEKLQKKVLVINNKLEDQSNKLEEQTNNLEEQNNKISNQGKTIEELQKKVLVINNKVEEQTNKLAEQNNKLEVQNNKVEEQNNKLEEQANKVEEQSNMLEGQNNKLEEQSKKLEEQNKTIEELQKKVLVYSGMAKSCKEIKALVPSSASGIYEIEVDGEKLVVRCEMNSASGGWTVLHNRYDGSVNFNRSWTSFEEGFGDLNGEFWLGLKNLNKLTKNSVNDLRVEMSSFDGRKKYAEYKEFRVGNSTENYKLSFKRGSYSGDAGDSLLWNNGMEFSTFDNDNDEWRGDCAASRGGANWWESCGGNNMNGKYGGKGDIDREFMWWWLFDNNVMSLKSMTLMFRQVD